MMAVRRRLGTERHWVVGSLVLAGCLAASGAGSAPGSSLGDDARLSGRVELAAAHLPVDEFLVLCTSKTGVDLTAVGAAADLRVSAVLRNVSLSDVMLGLSDLLHLSWRRTGSDPRPSYELYASADDARVVAREQRREWDRFRSNIRQLLTQVATGGAPSGNAEVDEAARALSTQGSNRTAARLVLQMPASFLDEALYRGRATVPVARLTAEQRNEVRAFEAGFYADALRGLSFPDGKEAAFATKSGLVKIQRPEASSEGGGFAVECSVRRRDGDGDQSSFAIRVLGDRGTRGFGVGFCVENRPDLSPAKLRTRCRFGPGAFVPRGTTIRELPDATLQWEAMLQRFAESNRVSVLSDAFDPIDLEPRLGPGRLWRLADDSSNDEVLDRLCVPYDYQWSAERLPVLFRHRKWYMLRDRQVSERLARGWRSAAQQRHQYQLADLAQMAELTEVQRFKLWKYAGDPATELVTRHLLLLKFYASLSELQRRRLPEDGLAVAHLSIPQRDRLAPALDAMGLRQSTFASSVVRVRASDAGEDGLANFSFSLRDRSSRVVGLRCRVVSPPAAWEVLNRY